MKGRFHQIQLRRAIPEDFADLLVLFRQVWPTKPINEERLREVYVRVVLQSSVIDAGREAAPGSIHEVLKNFPTEPELISAVDGLGTGVRVLFLQYYWVLSYLSSSGAI